MSSEFCKFGNPGRLYTDNTYVSFVLLERFVYYACLPKQIRMLSYSCKGHFFSELTDTQLIPKLTVTGKGRGKEMKGKRSAMH